MKKRICIILLTLSLLVSAFQVSIFAADPGGLEVSQTNLNAGDEFTVTFTVPANTTLAVQIEIHIAFNKDVVNLKSFAPPELPGATKTNSDVDASNKAGKFTVTYDNTASGDPTIDLSNGLTFTATMVVLDGVAEGTECVFEVVKYNAYSLESDGFTEINLAPAKSEYTSEITAVVGTSSTPVPTYTVTFDSADGSAVDSQTVESGKTATKPADPTKEGFTFDGWYLDGKLFDFSTPIEADITLKAQWTQNAHEHDWGTPTYEWAANNSTVTATRVCKTDASHTETETVNTTSKVTTPATCKAKGKTTYTAVFKNAAFETQTKTVEDIEALGHDWGEWTVTTPATCENKGEETRTCKNDTTHTETRETAALGHDWGEWTVTTPATETTDGVETHTCKRDSSHTETRPIPALGHTHLLVETEAVAADCTTDGTEAYWTCSGCGKMFSDAEGTKEISEPVKIPAKGHTPAEAVKENEVAATCKAEGSYDEVIYCSVCGEKLSSEKKIVEKTAHIPADAVQENVVGATCTTAGSYDEVVYCSVCGEEISRVAHTGELIEHDWSEWKETTAPTCTTKGLRTRTCSVCGTEEIEEIDVVDHKFEITNTVEATCEKDGYVVSICKICGEKNVETLKKLGHDWGKWTVTKEATEDEEGEETRTCARCGEKETRPIAKISNTDFEEALARSLRYAAMTLRQRAAVEEAARKAAEEAAKKAAEEAAKKALPFTDVAKDSPAYDDIKYAYDNGILIGLSDTTFGENIPLTRGMIVTVLCRMEGKVQVNTFGTFTDVPAGEWYSDAVEWAASHDIVLGYGDGTFGPMDDVTREQLAAILFRYAQYKGYDVSVGEDTNILSYYDAFTWGQWAVPALQWACGAGVIEDSPLGMLRPTEPATRGEIALAIHVFCEEVAK